MTSENSLGEPRSVPLAISMGDACGIGPEIIARLWQQGAVQDAVVVGDPAVMRRALRVVGGGLAVATLTDLSERPRVPPYCLPVWAPEGLPADLVEAPVGQIDARAGAAAQLHRRLFAAPA